MCGVQIGTEQLKSILAHGEMKGASAACGLQVGHEELGKIIAHSQAEGAKLGSKSAACGIQVGHEIDAMKNAATSPKG